MIWNYELTESPGADAQTGCCTKKLFVIAVVTRPLQRRLWLLYSPSGSETEECNTFVLIANVCLQSKDLSLLKHGGFSSKVQLLH